MSLRVNMNLWQSEKPLGKNYLQLAIRKFFRCRRFLPLHKGKRVRHERRKRRRSSRSSSLALNPIIIGAKTHNEIWNWLCIPGQKEEGREREMGTRKWIERKEGKLKREKDFTSTAKALLDGWEVHGIFFQMDFQTPHFQSYGSRHRFRTRLETLPSASGMWIYVECIYCQNVDAVSVMVSNSLFRVLEECRNQEIHKVDFWKKVEKLDFPPDMA